MKDLAVYRQEIDRIDKELVKLLNERAVIVLKISRLKKKKNLPIFDKRREKQMVERITHLNSGPLRDKEVKNIFREIICVSQEIQRQKLVAYLGPKGTFSNFACLKRFPNALHLPYTTILRVVKAVIKNEANLAVVPLENSMTGKIKETHSSLKKYQETEVVDQFTFPIHLAILVQKEVKLKDIKSVASKDTVFKQCSLWLKNNFQGIKRLNLKSTAEAAILVKKKPEIAAIGHKFLAKRYNLKLAAVDIENKKNNQTTFVVLKKIKNL